MPDLEVRPATDADIEQLEPLLDDALSRLRSFRGGDTLLGDLGVGEGTTTEVARILATPGGGVICYVAVQDDAVIAMAAGVLAAGRLDLLGVHTARSLRRRRVGTTLLEAMAAHAAREGIGIEALALPGDQTLKSLLESAGYRARLLRLSAER